MYFGHLTDKTSLDSHTSFMRDIPAPSTGSLITQEAQVLQSHPSWAT